MTEPGPAEVAAAKLKIALAAQRGEQAPAWVHDVAAGRPTARERAGEFEVFAGTSSITMRHVLCKTAAAFGPDITAAQIMGAIETHLDPARKGELFSCPLLEG